MPWPFGPEGSKRSWESIDGMGEPRPNEPTQLRPDLAPRVRNEDSVVAEIVRARGDTLWKVGAMARRMSNDLKDAVVVLHDSSRSALRRFESLPRRKQLMWVAAPYLGAAFLVGLLLALNSAAHGPVAISPISTAIAEPAAPPVTPMPDLQPVTPPAPAVERTPEPPPAPAPEPVLRELPVRAVLYVRPDIRYNAAAHLRARSQVTVYTDFPAPEGWVLAVSEKGTVGYLEAARLEGAPADRRPHRHKKKRVRPRRRK